MVDADNAGETLVPRVRASRSERCRSQSSSLTAGSEVDADGPAPNERGRTRLVVR